MESNVLVDVVTDVANVQVLEVFEEVAICHPEASIVKRLRVELFTDSITDVSPPCVFGMPRPNPTAPVGSGTVLHTDNLAAIAEIGHLGNPVDIADLKSKLRRLCQSQFIVTITLVDFSGRNS